MADTLGVDKQTVSLWERSKRRPAVAAERMLRLLYLEFADGTTKLAEMIEFQPLTALAPQPRKSLKRKRPKS